MSIFPSGFMSYGPQQVIDSETNKMLHKMINIFF